MRLFDLSEGIMYLQTLLSFDNSYFMDVVDGGLQHISMQHVKDLLETNYSYLSGVCMFADHYIYCHCAKCMQLVFNSFRGPF